MRRIDPQTRAEARRQRRDASPVERRLWGALRAANKAHGLNFRCKAPVGPQIADFADYARRVIVQIDDGAAVTRAERMNWFAAQGFRVLPCLSSALAEDFDDVIATIISETLASPHPIPPHKGEGAASGGPGPWGASLPLVGREREGGATSIMGDTQ